MSPLSSNQKLQFDSIEAISLHVADFKLVICAKLDSESRQFAMVYSYFRNPDTMHWSIKSWLGALLCVLIMQRHAAVAQVDISTK